jgi:hypothetical protein
MNLLFQDSLSLGLNKVASVQTEYKVETNNERSSEFFNQGLKISTIKP